MRVCLLVHELRPSGGVSVILAHARGLRAAGHDVELVATGPADGAPDDLRVRRLADARGVPYDWAIATWWETAAALFEVQAARRLVLLQSFEERFYTERQPLQQLGAAAVLELPLDFVAVSEWMCEALARLRPGARCRVVPNGVDKAVFASARRERSDGPLRVRVEGQPTLWFKGVREALAATRAMTEPAEVTLVSLAPGDFDPDGADRVLSGLSLAEMAELYAGTDVLVKLSRIEGFGLPLIEAAHAGVPCVATPFGAHADLIEHGTNGLVVGHDDLPGVTNALDLLARDRELLERLAAGALELAQRIPDQADAGLAFARALEELDAESPPGSAAAVAGLLAAIGLAEARDDGTSGDAAAALDEVKRALAEAQGLVHELSGSRDDCADLLRQAHAELDAVRSAFSYRAARKLRSVARRARP